VKQSILKRYPELTVNDVELRDDANEKGVYIAYWNSDKPQPTMDQVKTWHEEDIQNYVEPKTVEELLIEEQAKTRRLETQLNQTNADLQGFMDFYFENMPL
jgi:hypothetical protein